MASDRVSFTGREFDGEFGLYYYRARYYDPTAGRFISADPLGFAAGDVNLYRYVGNRPTGRTDPFGLWRDEHADLTESCMRSAGFSEEDIKMAIKGNLDVDRWTNQRNNAEHYMPGYMEDAEAAIEHYLMMAVTNEMLSNHAEAMDLLGRAMHIAQDKGAHYDQDAGWLEHLDGTRPDNPAKHPKEYNDSFKYTGKVIRRYYELLKAREERVPR